jgi:S-adenosylmethionine synthetase
MDDWATRFPTLVDDVAKVLVALAGELCWNWLIYFWKKKHPALFSSSAYTYSWWTCFIEYKEPLPPILHFSSEEEYTKYKISLVFAKLLKLSEAEIKNLVAQPEPPQPAQGETMRPRDCRLSNRTLASLGISIEQARFVDWWAAYLSNKWVYTPPSLEFKLLVGAILWGPICSQFLPEYVLPYRLDVVVQVPLEEWGNILLALSYQLNVAI